MKLHIVKFRNGKYGAYKNGDKYFTHISGGLGFMARNSKSPSSQEFHSISGLKSAIEYQVSHTNNLDLGEHVEVWKI